MIVRPEDPSDEAVRALFATVSSPELIDRRRPSDAWPRALFLLSPGVEGEVVGDARAGRIPCR